jgi:hypothetical protein
VTICPSGLTQTKTGVAAFVNYGSSAAGLLSLVARFAKLAPLAYALGGVAYATATLCAQEPPAVPTMTQNEVNAIANNNLLSGDYYSGLAKLRDMVTVLAWYELCECQSGGAVTLPTPPVQPAPPLVSPTNLPNTTVICAQNTTNPRTWAAIGGGLVNSNPGVLTTTAGAVGLDLTVNVALTGGGSPDTSIGQVDKYNGSTHGGRLSDFTIGTSGSFHATYLVDPAFPHIVLSLTPTGGGTPTGQTIDVLGILTCSSGPSIGPQGCCPPDPAVTSQLNQILNYVTLLQRQLVPFAYVSGTAHTGLSGAGSISIQGLLGAKVECTTIPTSYGRAGTSPTEYFELGYLTFGTADGFPSSYKLERQELLMLPARCSAYTELDYDLSPGVVVTITEIKREP